MTELYGQEFLGAAKYEKFAINNLPKGRCGKTFSKEFGPSQKVLRKWAEQGTHPVVATQGLWRGGAHDYSGQKILTEGLQELEKFAKIASDFKDQAFQFSIFCEHKLDTAYLEKVFTEQWKIVKGLTNLTLVNTPMSGGALLKPNAFGFHLLNEIHGTWNPSTKGMAPYMWGCDGLPAQDADIQMFKDRHVKSMIIWLWMQQYNCKKKVDEATPISQRKVKPVEKQVISLEYLIPNKGNVVFNKDSLFKTHGDQHGPIPVGREQKPVVITKADAEKLQFIAADGRVVAESLRAGNYLDGRPMYRIGAWGFEVQDKAVKVSGQAIVKVIAVKGKKKTNLGTVNPAFRQNAYRLKALKLVGKLKGKAEAVLDIDEVSVDWV